MHNTTIPPPESFLCYVVYAPLYAPPTAIHSSLC
jgi:hypothetical protein